MEKTDHIVPLHIHCARCGNKWTIENCVDFITEDVLRPCPDVDSNIGKTLAQLEADLNAQNDGEYCISPTVRNNRWKSKSTRATPLERDGWRTDESKKPITMEYVLRLGDEIQAYCCRYFHSACYQEEIAEREARQAAEAAKRIGDMLILWGFEGVLVRKEAIPKYICDWIGAVMGVPGANEASLEEIYLRVETAQGNFGFFLAEYPLIDLTDTGVNPVALAPTFAHAPLGFPPLVTLNPQDGAMLLLLWQLLTKQQRNNAK